jgi:hypothetical protein
MVRPRPLIVVVRLTSGWRSGVTDSTFAIDTLARRAATTISRRRSLLALGGALSAATAASPLATARRKKHRKKKRDKTRRGCTKLGDNCTAGGRSCCGQLACDQIGDQGPTRCCKLPGEPCEKFDDCCSGFCLNNGPGTPGTCLDT